MIFKADVWINAQHFEDRVVNVAGPQRSILRNFTQTIGGTDHLPAAQSAASHQHRHRIAPMVSTGSSLAERWSAVAPVVHLRCAAKFSHHHDQYLVQQASFFQVREQAVHRHVDLWQMSFHGGLMIPVTVPAAEMT